MAYSELHDTPGRRRRAARFRSLQTQLGVRKLLRVAGHAASVPEGLRFRFINRLYGAEYCSPEPFEADFFGLRYIGDLSSLLDWYVYFFGAYERENLFLLRDLLTGKAAPIFIDVGANVGLFSLFLSRFASHVHAFEPWCKVRNAFQQRVTINGIKNISIYPVALGEKNERLPFYAPKGANLGTGSFCADHAPDRNRLLGELDVVNGDDYLELHNVSRVDVMKIDVEGREKSVLLGLRETLARSAPFVFLEVSETSLRAFGNIDEFRKCVPAVYQADYVLPKRGSIEYYPFDCTRPGNVLLHVQGCPIPWKS